MREVRPLKDDGQQREHIRCIVRRKVFFAPKEGFSVFLAVRDDNHKTISVTGNSFEVSEGIHLDVEGRWEHHREYGRQFAAVSWVEIRPETEEGIIKYLSSGKIKGIGRKFARDIVARFGVRTFEVIQSYPGLLREIKGLGEKRIQRAHEFLATQSIERDVMVFLSGFNISYVFVKKIIKAFGAKAVVRVRENPYCLIEHIDGISFSKADEIAKSMGYEDDDPRRLQSGVIFVMSQLVGRGHVFCLRESLVIKSVCTLLDIKEKELRDIPKDTLEVLKEKVTTAVQSRIRDGQLIEDSQRVYLPELHRAEKFCAKMVTEIIGGFDSIFPDGNDEQIISDTVAFIGNTEHKTYNSEQMEAVRQALKSRVMVLTGGPGTGKTTVMKGILHALREKGYDIAVCAPTGRAAKRAKESTGYDSKTIHRLLEFSYDAGGFTRNEENPLDENVVIIDESSMIDILLFESLLRAMTPYKRLILVGDVDQLPSVGPGNVLKDLIDSGCVSVVRLTQIYRQDDGSRIVWNAQRIIQGMMPCLDNRGSRDFYYIEKEDEQQVAETVVSLVCERLPKAYGLSPVEIQVLSPTRKRGLSCCNSLNMMIQEKLGLEGDTLCYGDTVFHRGDRVMQIKNDYEKNVFNGDVGIVREVNGELGFLDVDYPEAVVRYNENDLDEILLSYACTIHKSQGSEYGTVIIPITAAAYTMLQRNLIYTAITRAKERCIIIGNKKTIQIAVSNYVTEYRRTLLKERIQENVRTASCLRKYTEQNY